VSPTPAVRRGAVPALLVALLVTMAAAPLAAAAQKPLDPDDPDLYRPASRRPSKPQPSVLEKAPAIPVLTTRRLQRGVVITPRPRPTRTARSRSERRRSPAGRAVAGDVGDPAPTSGPLAATLRPAATLDPNAAVIQRASGRSSLLGLAVTVLLPGVAFVLWRRRTGPRVS